MLIQRLYKTGNSVAVTIPKEYLKELHLKVGGLVAVKKRGGELVVSPKTQAETAGVDQKFARMVDEFVNEHEDVLQELSKR